ncbi:CPBP family intramembrane metalloprotease [Rhizobium sp. PRIMUS64]|uniref:CPBP family intramembrane glutamic endopeptidase n=1 Tax=Rhizobium TaxID=379 RepID=UPI001AE3CF60|nr:MULTISPECIES: type II CAAX endopeptidase family protein [Rhizobium]MBP2486322.1 membrane protease YdiL (CAAX protease family) [Rhizobium leguminosarum]MCJ9694716.1 CPBP family intramembrane metalloprotease [Rhizobium sp. PRIMUS64]
MTSIRGQISRYPLFAFFAIAYILTWLGWILPERIYAGTLLTGALALPFLLMVPGPLYAALIVTAITGGRPGIGALLKKFAIRRVGWEWFAVALLLAPAIGVTAAYLNMVFGGPNPTAALIASVPTILMMFAIRLVNPLDGPMQEELGWRGFALPRLQERHLPLVASAILGVLVVIWHVPLVLLDMLPAYALFGTFAFTIVFGWLFNNTRGSVLMTLIAHAADGLVITGNLGLNAIDSQRQIMLLVATWCVTALVVVMLYGATLTGKPNTHMPRNQPRA